MKEVNGKNITTVGGKIKVPVGLLPVVASVEKD